MNTDRANQTGFEELFYKDKKCCFCGSQAVAALITVDVNQNSEYLCEEHSNMNNDAFDAMFFRFMEMYVFEANETGPPTYCVMSYSKEAAMQAVILSMSNDERVSFAENRHKYTVTAHDINRVFVHENC